MGHDGGAVGFEAEGKGRGGQIGDPEEEDSKEEEFGGGGFAGGGFGGFGGGGGGGDGGGRDLWAGLEAKFWC